MDLLSRKIVGWYLDDNMEEGLIVAAFKKALSGRTTGQGMMVHSDISGQYAGSTFRAMLMKRKIDQSMSRANNPYDNAFMESCFSRFKAELLEGGIFESIEDAQTVIFQYIEMYYNPKRIHSSLDYLSPDAYEKKYYHCLT